MVLVAIGVAAVKILFLSLASSCSGELCPQDEEEYGEGREPMLNHRVQCKVVNG
jgi:hypothetical protein